MVSASVSSGILLTYSGTGAIEQAVTSHPAGKLLATAQPYMQCADQSKVAEACVVGIPDALKGHLPFAFMTLNTADHPKSAVPSEELFKEVQTLVRDQIGKYVQGHVIHMPAGFGP